MDKFNKQLVSLETKTRSVVFGSKKLFKKQFTVEHYQKNHALWRGDFQKARYNKMTLSGRKDARSGNFVFHYNTEDKSLDFQTPDGVCIKVPDVLFPYGQQNIEEAVNHQKTVKDKKKFGKPIAWSTEDHGDYYIFKCLIVEPEKEYKNFSKKTGVIGVDLNVDHIASSNINNIGQLVKTGVFSFDIQGKTSNQITKIIEAEAIALVDIAVKENKPLVLEKLNTTKSKVSHAYGHKKANRMMSSFTYNKLISAIKSRAEKMGVHVYEVNPAYTSQIGKMKYMKRFGISIHQAASFVIARRAMGFKEKLPPVLHSLVPEKKLGLHHWAQWGSVSKLLSDIRTQSYYQSELFDVHQFHKSELLFCGALTDYEAKGLPKLKSRKITAWLNRLWSLKNSFRLFGVSCFWRISFLKNSSEF